MPGDIDQNNPEIAQLLAHYEKWRRIYGYAGKTVPDVPDWENARLYFREGFPYPDWTAYIIEPVVDGYQVFSASTERRATPLEAPEATFSRFTDAGKYIIFEMADNLRVRYRIDPVTWAWQAARLDPRVEKVILDDRHAKYFLRADPDSYFIAYPGGIQPYNHILPLSYDELDIILFDGFSEKVHALLAAESD